MLIVDKQDVERTFAMPVAIRVMREALMALDRGEALQPPRASVSLPPAGAMCWLMPAYAGHPASLGVKVLTAFAGNAGSAFDTHQGAVLLFGDHGELLALVDATSITATRTAAVSAVATDALARADATRLAILGSGAQAMSHMAAMREVRSISMTTVWSRSVDHADRFARAVGDAFDVDVQVCRTVAQAVADADIICTATGAQTPILDDGLIRRGVHINAVGSGSAMHRELSSAVVRDAVVYVDRIESALREAGEIVLAIADGTITDAHIQGEIGAVLTGRVHGRRSDGEVTLFKSVGLGVEDVAAASAIHAACVRQGFGTQVSFGVSAR
ncbi:MAG: ornithine cyclodeaminase family protein [Gemmatimonadota bacterium]|nr:ornithine cyclodeaminase family protein [Gemmatimonadota bacterium]